VMISVCASPATMPASQRVESAFQSWNSVEICREIADYAIDRHVGTREARHTAFAGRGLCSCYFEWAMLATRTLIVQFGCSGHAADQ